MRYQKQYAQGIRTNSHTLLENLRNMRIRNTTSLVKGYHTLSSSQNVADYSTRYDIILVRCVIECRTVSIYSLSEYIDNNKKENGRQR